MNIWGIISFQRNFGLDQKWRKQNDIFCEAMQILDGELEENTKGKTLHLPKKYPTQWKGGGNYLEIYWMNSMNSGIQLSSLSSVWWCVWTAGIPTDR